MSSFESASTLEALGFSPFFHHDFLSTNPDSGLVPERVTVERRSEYRVTGPLGIRRAVLSGKLRHELEPAERPCTGDWVVCAPGSSEPARIERVLARSTLFLRRAAGRTSEAQPIAANVDVVAVVCAFASSDAPPEEALHALNPRRIERYLAATRTAGCRALVVVNKVDLRGDADELVAELRARLRGTDIATTSATSGAGIDGLAEYFARGETAVFVGPSGVGKSSLTNRLFGADVQRVSAVREADAKGRHTTTERELRIMPGGWVLIDTPGMRELGLSPGDDDERSAFDDIDALARECRFADCQHGNEPGCAVRSAVERGILAEERLASADKLAREAAFQRRRVDEAARRHERAAERRLARARRQWLAENGRK